MPPTEEALEKFLEVLGRMRVESFTATPTSVLPGNPIELRWQVSGVDFPASLFLNGVEVRASGTQTVTPFRTTGFSLEARGVGTRHVLGGVQVAVDLTGCSVHSIPESEVREQIRDALEQQFPHQEGRLIKNENGPNVRLRVRNDRTVVRVGVDGLRIAGELDADVNNAPDGAYIFDTTIALGAENGRATHKIARFDGDFDFDNSLSGIFARPLELLVDSRVDELVKPELNRSIAQLLAAQVALLAITDCALVSVSPAARRIDFTLCPTAEGANCTDAIMRRVLESTRSHTDIAI